MNLALFGDLLQGWTPFVTSGGWVLAVGLFLVFLNGTRFNQNKQMAEFNSKAIEDLQGDFDNERRRRDHAEIRGDRWRASARWWNAKCHDERIGRTQDRIFANQHYAGRLTADQMVTYDALLPLPKMVELEEEQGGHL